MLKSEKYKKLSLKLKYAQTRKLNIKIDDKTYRRKPGFLIIEHLYNEDAKSKYLYLNILDESPDIKHNSISIDIVGYIADPRMKSDVSDVRFDDKKKAIKFKYKGAYLNQKENRWKQYTQIIEITFEIADEYVEFKNLLKVYLKPKTKNSEIYRAKKFVRTK